MCDEAHLGLIGHLVIDYTQERAAGMARHSALTALARGDKKHNNNTQLCLLLTRIYLFKNE